MKCAVEQSLREREQQENREQRIESLSESLYNMLFDETFEEAISIIRDAGNERNHSSYDAALLKKMADKIEDLAGMACDIIAENHYR